METLCPNCQLPMESRLHDFQDGETLDIWECGVCGYAEWNCEGESWSFGGSGPLPEELRARAGDPRTQRATNRAGRN